jgi:RNA polymerase sigma-70 factor (ECF subfamily)
MDFEDKNEELRRLIALSALEDRQAFYQLYQRTKGYLNGVAYNIVKNDEISRDVLQEAFIQIWDNSASYRPELAQPLTWLTSIVRYRALDRLAKDKRREQTFIAETTHEPECEHNPWSELVRLQHHKQLVQCLSQLTQDQASSIKLAYIQGYSREEIADRLHTKINTVKSWLHRAQEKLKQCLSHA